MIKRLLPALLLAAFLLPAHHPVNAADLLDVKFELTRESPVSVEFRVTITNAGQNVTNLPMELLFERLPVSVLRNISITEVTLATLSKEEPVIESQEIRYKPTGLVTITESDGGKYFIESPVDAKGEVTKEGAFEYYDSKTNEFVWHEDVQTGTKQVAYQAEQAEPFKQWYTHGKTAKLTAAFNQPANDDNEFGWGAGVRVFDVKIITGELVTDSGWGSAGLMVWDVGGKLWWDDTNSSWWDTDWLYRQDITLLNGAYAENLVSFPVGVFLDDTNFDFTQAQPDGDDIRFVDADGTTDLDHEIVSWDAVNEYAEIWVEVPQVNASSNTDFVTMYWGNSTCANGEDVAGAWNSAFVAVYHMNDNPANSAQILDSTSNANVGAKKGAGEPVEAAGLVGKAQDFDGSNDYVRVTNNATIQIVEEISIEVAFNSSDDFAAAQNLVTRVSYSTWYNGWILGVNASKQLYMVCARNINEAGGIIYSSSNAIQPNTEYVVAGTRTRAFQTIYRNGSQLNQEASYDAEMVSPARDMGIGIYNDNWTSYPVDGLISELRISNVARSASWIAATNKTLRDEYVTLGDVQGKPSAPLNLTAAVLGNNIELAWTKGYLALDTIIVRGSIGYPASLTDGVVVYNGTASSFTESGLATEGGIYYYSAWSSSDWGYSTDYATTIWGGDMLELIEMIITLGFLLALVGLAYWRRTGELYLIASVGLFIYAAVWWAEWFYIAMICVFLALITIIRGMQAFFKR